MQLLRLSSTTKLPMDRISSQVASSGSAYAQRSRLLVTTNRANSPTALRQPSKASKSYSGLTWLEANNSLKPKPLFGSV